MRISFPRLLLCLGLGLPLGAGCGGDPQSGGADLSGPFANPDGGSGSDGGTGACGVANTAKDCGTCGHACPGMGLSNADATCPDPTRSQCGISCRGENYDIDNDPANGCERLRQSPAGHSKETAADRGHKTCNDGSSTDSFNADLLSDARPHGNPPIDGWSGLFGAAPDFWKVSADGGGGCVDDYDVTIQITGGGGIICYQLSVITDKKTDSATVTGTGSANLKSGSGSYSDGTIVYFKVEKLCTLPIQESVNYRISYHL